MEEPNILNYAVSSHARTESGALTFKVITPYSHEWTVICQSDGSWSYVTPAGSNPRPLQVRGVQAAIGRYLVECFHAGQAVYGTGDRNIPNPVTEYYMRSRQLWYDH